MTVFQKVMHIAWLIVAIVALWRIGNLQIMHTHDLSGEPALKVDLKGELKTNTDLDL